jgi:hypothetical protein
MRKNLMNTKLMMMIVIINKDNNSHIRDKTIRDKHINTLYYFYRQ